jgi:hypothetical protein
MRRQVVPGFEIWGVMIQYGVDGNVVKFLRPMTVNSQSHLSCCTSSLLIL